MYDEYSDEELAYCVQVVEQIARLPLCDGNVAMMGKSWSAINALMVAARDDVPEALRTVLFCCGTDDRFDDDVHYKGGAMMYDNASWAESMWGWMPMPPDPAIVGDRWNRCGENASVTRILVRPLGAASDARCLLARDERPRSYVEYPYTGLRAFRLARRL